MLLKIRKLLTRAQRNSLRLLTMFAVASVATSCERRQLWDEWDTLAPVDIDVDWSKSRWADFDEGEKPTGMSVYAFDKAGQQKPVLVTTNNIEHTQLSLYDGDWSIFLFNQSVQEYASLQFSGMDNYNSAKVETVPQTSRWFSSSRAGWVTRSNSPWALQTRTRTRTETRDDEYSLTTKQPVWFASDHSTGTIIDEGSIIRDFTPHTRAAESKYTTLSSIVKVAVKVHFNGIYNLHSVRAVISGVAKSFNISQMSTLSEMTAHEITGWHKEMEEGDTQRGYVEATFQTFGLVRDYNPNPEGLYLHVDVLLVDGETIITKDLPVGHLVREVPQSPGEDLDLIIDVDDVIDLPNVKIAGGGNGFDITVSDWEDEIKIDIDL